MSCGGGEGKGVEVRVKRLGLREKRLEIRVERLERSVLS